MAGCSEEPQLAASNAEVPAPVLEVDTTPRIKPRHGGRLITLARIEGGVDYASGKPWVRVVKNDSAARAAAKAGIGVSQQAIVPSGHCGISDTMIGGYGSAAPIEFYDGSADSMTTDDDGDLNNVGMVTGASTCITRSSDSPSPTELVEYNTDGIGCLQFNIKNKSAQVFEELFVDVDTYNGTVADHTPYIFPDGPPGAVDGSFLDARNSPSEAHGLWTFGEVDAGTVLMPEHKTVWGFFREKLDSPFNWKGSLIAEKLEICNNGVDDDCDGLQNNGCHMAAANAECFTDSDCAVGLACVGAKLSASFGKGPGDADQKGKCGALPGSMLGTGNHHACAITSTGTIKCWGSNDDGALGVPDQSAAVSAPDLNFPGLQAKALAVGALFNCAIFDDDTVRCWGDNSYEQVTADAVSSVPAGASDPVPPPLSIGGGVGVKPVQISAGMGHVCVVRSDNQVRCWGNNAHGQIGIQSGDAVIPIGSAVDLTLPTGASGGATNVCANHMNTCVLGLNGKVFCWGQTSNGQTGLGVISGNPDKLGDDEAISALPAVQVLTPEDVEAGRYVRQIACGIYHTCAVLNSGDMRCWGANDFGELGVGQQGVGTSVGDDEHPSMKALVKVGIGRKVLKVSAGYNRTCVLLDNDSIKCWGNAIPGCLGHGDSCSGPIDLPYNQAIDFSVPVGVRPVDISTGAFGKTICARFDNGGIKCWGNNDGDSCGLNTGTNPVDPPSLMYTIPPDPICGNNMVDYGETCDDGNAITEVCEYGEQICDVCDSSCHLVAGETSYCGDGMKDPGEGCDDGNTTTETDCAYQMTETACTVCSGGCEVVQATPHFCGDFIPDPGETCDNSDPGCDEVCEYSCISGTHCAQNASCNFGNNECECNMDYVGSGYTSNGGCIANFKRVFVTFNSFTPTQIGSLTNADALCASEVASVGGLGNPANWKAWLSDSTAHASLRLTWSTGWPIKRVDGVKVAHNLSNLLDTGSDLLAPINRSANGSIMDNVPVWTATGPEGFFNGGNNDCSDWTDEAVMSSLVGGGYSNIMNNGWTLSASFWCSGMGHLYCFEQ